MSSELISNFDAKQKALLDEQCIVVDSYDRQIGSGSKQECHLLSNINKGIIHRAFSVLLFNSCGEFLLTQRSDYKITFPSYFGNSCCSHPLYNDLERDEENNIGIKRAAQRRLQKELGIEPNDITLDDIVYITRFIYKTSFDDIWGEYEIDYILVIYKDVKINPDPNEVKFYKYLPKEQLKFYLENETSKNNPVGIWFKIIIDNFLFKIWNNLDELHKVQDHNIIHGNLN